VKGLIAFTLVLFSSRGDGAGKPGPKGEKGERGEESSLKYIFHFSGLFRQLRLDAIGANE